jgi:hypothetical protein
VSVADGTALAVSVGVGTNVKVFVREGVNVAVGVSLGIGVSVRVGVDVGVMVGVKVGKRVGMIWTGVQVTNAVGVCVSLSDVVLIAVGCIFLLTETKAKPKP